MSDVNSDELDKIIVPGMGRARLIHDCGYPDSGDGEQRHYFDNEADEEYIDMVKAELKALINKRVREAKKDEQLMLGIAINKSDGDLGYVVDWHHDRDAILTQQHSDEEEIGDE